MKLTFTVLLVLILGTPPISAQTSSDNRRVVRILTFNILHGATTQGDFNLDFIADVIKRSNPDLVALQEVDFKTNRAKKYDLVTELGWRTNLAPLFGRAMKYDGGEYGEGILSAFSFICSRNVALPHSPESEPRTALEIVVELPSGDTVALEGTHLDHLKDEKDRLAQVEKINEVFTLNQHPTILAGDLNAVPGSRPIGILEEWWTATYDKNDPYPTFPSDNPSLKIDYIMYYPRNRWSVLESAVICDSIASDHCAYLVVLELMEE